MQRNYRTKPDLASWRLFGGRTLIGRRTPMGWNLNRRTASAASRWFKCVDDEMSADSSQDAPDSGLSKFQLALDREPQDMGLAYPGLLCGDSHSRVQPVGTDEKQVRSAGHLVIGQPRQGPVGRRPIHEPLRPHELADVRGGEGFPRLTVPTPEWRHVRYGPLAQLVGRRAKGSVMRHSRVPGFIAGLVQPPDLEVQQRCEGHPGRVGNHHQTSRAVYAPEEHRCGDD